MQSCLGQACEKGRITNFAASENQLGPACRLDGSCPGADANPTGLGLLQVWMVAFNPEANPHANLAR